jgi:WD40 repeat protein
MSYDRTIAVWQLDSNVLANELSRTTFPAIIWARAGSFLDAERIIVGTFGSRYGIFHWRTQTWDLSNIVADKSLNAVAVVQDAIYTIGDAGILFRNNNAQTNMGSLCNFLLVAGEMLLTGGQLGQLFDAHTGAILYQHRSPLNCGTTFLRDNKLHVAIGTYTGEMLLFSVEKNTLHFITCLEIYQNAIKGLCANQQQIFSVCASTDIAWHNISDFSCQLYQEKAHERIANACCLAGQSGFATISRDLKLRIWENDYEEIYPSPHPNSIKCICSNTDHTILMTGAYTGTVAGFDIKTRTWSSFSRPTASGISSLAYDEKHHRFLASSYDGHVYPITNGE